MKTFSTKLTLLTIMAFASASSTQTINLSSMHNAIMNTASTCLQNVTAVAQKIDALPFESKALLAVCFATTVSFIVYLKLSGKLPANDTEKHSGMGYADARRHGLTASNAASKSTTFSFSAPKKVTTSETKEAKYQKEREAAAERYYDYR